MIVSKAMRFEDVPIGATAVAIETMGDGSGYCEIRRTYYERAAGSTLHPYNVKAYRLGMTQGVEGEQPRYANGPHRNSTEVHAKMLVHLDDQQ